MPVLDNTIMGETANSYVDVPYFQDYWQNHFDTVTATDLLALNDDQAATLLLRACRTIETLRFTEPVSPLAEYHQVYDSRSQTLRFMRTNFDRPQKYDYYQHLQFPRTLDEMSTGEIVIPEEVKNAQCEQAAYLKSLDPTALANALQGVVTDSMNVDGIQFSQRFRSGGSLISPVALDMLKPYLLKKFVRIERG